MDAGETLRKKAVLIVTTGAFGLLLAFASAAKADITNPSSPGKPYQPQSGFLQPSKVEPKGQPAATPAPTPAPQPIQEEQPAEQPTVATGQTPGVAAPAATPAAAPAPEHVVTKAAPSIHRSGSNGSGLLGAPSRRPFDQAIGAVHNGLQQAGAFFGEVASACKVGVASSTGGPVLVFAVLGIATALERRRISMIRPATNEDAPEMLYAWDVIAPG